jgi:protein-S-isoprenylcysteine O-methyltransferase Ste14
MNDDQVNEALGEIERALLAEDPAFAHRVNGTRRREAIHVVVVFVLLASGAVLLTVGFATNAFVPWSLGVAALLAAVLIDDHHRRAVG